MLRASGGFPISTLPVCLPARCRLLCNHIVKGNEKSSAVEGVSDAKCECSYRTSISEDEAVIRDATAGPRQKIAARLLKIEKSIYCGKPTTGLFNFVL